MRLAGGFPDAQRSLGGKFDAGVDRATRHRLLRDYVDVAMLRDVVERHNVRNVVALRWLVRHFLANAGSLFSVEKFHAALKSQGVAVAKDTVHQLVAHLEDCFLVRVVWMESASERQRWVNPRKAYPVDAGLIPVFDRTGRSNVGHALETAVLIELKRRGVETTYLRTKEGYEVDFVAGGSLEALHRGYDWIPREQVCAVIRLAGRDMVQPSAIERLAPPPRPQAPGLAR